MKRTYVVLNNVLTNKRARVPHLLSNSQTAKAGALKTQKNVQNYVRKTTLSAVCGERKQTPRVHVNYRNHSKPRSLKKPDTWLGSKRPPWVQIADRRCTMIIMQNFYGTVAVDNL